MSRTRTRQRLIIVTENVAREARIMTDESSIYGDVEGMSASHETVRHSNDEYIRTRASRVVHTNTVEGYFSIFKRGMKGVYQHCDEKHLHRYLAEFDFRYNNRIALGITIQRPHRSGAEGAVGKRLTYRQPDSANV